jgi:molecular chaperone DnaJ
MKYHPDHNPALEAREIFEQVQKAYEILADPVKRQEYDYGRKSAVTDKPQTFLTELWEGIFSQGLVNLDRR